MSEQHINVELLPVTAFQQNCSLLWDEDKNAAIIDPGGDAEKIIQRADELGLNVQAILLTHGHLDHVGAAQKLKAHYKVPVLGSAHGDAFWFENLPMQAQQFRLPTVETFTPDRWLDTDGEILEIGALRLEVLHLPGHTPGHIGFIDRQHKVAFTGDVLFQGSIGRTDFPQGDHATLLKSIREKLYPLGDEMIIIAGHGQPTTIGKEKMHNPFLS